MSESFELDGKEYSLDGNPKLKTVRAVQTMQNQLLLNYVDEKRLREMDSLDDEGEIIDAIIETGGMDALGEVKWERSMLEPVQTISLAADEVFSTDDFDEMPALKFEEVQVDAKDAIGGSVNDFFSRLNVGTSLTDAELEAMRQE